MQKLLLPCFVCMLIFSAFSNTRQHAFRQDIIFAVLDDGSVIEPIARIEDGKLVSAVNGSEDAAQITQFNEDYYKPKSTYTLIYGGKKGGMVTVKKSNTGTDCGGATAQVTTNAVKAKLKGFEMALATSILPPAAASGTRRLATPVEKTAIEKLVVKEFQKNKSSVKGMKAVKLTITDADNDKRNEIIGSYSVSPSANERGMLFFIATKAANGSYTLSYSSYHSVTKDEVMSGELADVDTGIYQEMLLDLLDTNADGVAEIFTISQSFEGVSFYIYSWDGSQWTRILDVANYHCAY